MKLTKIILLSLFFLLIINFYGYALEPIVTGTITEEFDDNIYFDANRVWDFLTTASLGLGLEHEGRRQSIFMLGHIDQNLYIRNFHQSNTAQDFELDYNLDFSENVAFGVNERFAHQPEAPDFEDQFGRSEVRNSYISNDINTNLEALMSRHFGMTIRYTNRLMYFINGGDNNSFQNGAGVDFNFPIDSANILFLTYGYLHSEYDDGEVIQGHLAGLGYTHAFTEQLSLTLRGGLGCILASGDDVDYSPNIQVSLTDDVDRNNTISLTFTLNHAISRYSSDIYENWQLSGDFTRQISDRFAMAASLFFGQGRFISSSIIDALAGLSLDFTYLLSEHMRVGTGYTFTYRSTKGDEIRDSYYYRDQVRLFFAAEL